jgi:sugar lactone lactonase YvrE
MKIFQVQPPAAIPGGEFTIRGANLGGSIRPEVFFGSSRGAVIVGSDDLVIARVPEAASIGEIVLTNSGNSTEAWPCEIGIQITDSVHPITSPVADAMGNIYTTFSGSRGQKTPVSVYKIDTNYNCAAFATDIMNASGLAFGPNGALYASSRNDGLIYSISASGVPTQFIEGMGIATGIAFDRDGFLYVGDRSGTIFKLSREGEVFVFTTLEPSVSAYHLAFGPDGYLYMTGPTTSSFDAVQRVSPSGEVSVFFRGLGRPQGLNFDANGNLYVAASFAGKRGVVRISPDGKAEHFLSGHNIVGLCFLPSRSMAVATHNAIYRVDVNISGFSLN